MENERIQEIFLLVGDKFVQVNKKTWFGLGIALAAVVPFYFLVSLVITQVLLHTYTPPQIIYNSIVREPLQLVERKIFDLTKNQYSGYIKIHNSELEWGVPNQAYTVEFKTYGGTVLYKFSSSVFILPSSEKIIALPVFNASDKPDVLDVKLGETKFVHKPELDVNLSVERKNLQDPPTGMIVSAGIKNSSAFTIKKINLPVAVYDGNNEIIAVGFTNINDVLSGETRTFQVTWPIAFPNAVRAEINPEVNIFDRNLFTTLPGKSPFDEKAQ